MPTKITFTPPFFPGHSVPQGLLPHDRGAQMLWYYYVLVTNSLDRMDKNLPLEDDPIRFFRFQKLYLSLARAYGIDPNEAVNYWEIVEKELMRLNSLRLDEALREGREGYTTYQPLPDKLKYPMKDADKVAH